jgi:hypothetical protein
MNSLPLSVSIPRSHNGKVDLLTAFRALWLKPILTEAR